MSPRAMDSRAPSAQGLPQRLWPGADGQHGAGEQRLLGGLAAAQTLARVVRPCYGPYGRQKLLVTARGDTVLTGYAAAILGALELEHPAARLLRDAALGQAERSGDGVAFVVLLAEALLAQAEHLLLAGLPRAQLRAAYAAAAAEALDLLPALAFRALGPLEDPSWALHSAMNTHALSHADHLARLVAHACWEAREPDGGFRPERVGVCALRGGHARDSLLLPGLVLAATPCGQVAAVPSGARVGLFACTFGPASPKAPATARLSSPLDLASFRVGSEQLVEKQVAQLAAADVNVAVVWGEVEERALAHADHYGVMVIQVKSRQELVYLSEVLDTPLMPHLVAPPELGRCAKVYALDLGEALAVVFEWESQGTPALTLVLRGATPAGLRGAVQAAYHGIDAYCQLCQDPRLLPGAGATELALAQMLADKGARLQAPDGPALLAFAHALRSVPATLAENAGLVVAKVMAEASAAHQAGNFFIGVGVEGIINVYQAGVWDTLIAKAQGIRAVADVALQLVTIDEIVVAKQSPTPQEDLNPNPKKAKKRLSPVGAKKSPLTNK